MNRQSAHAFPSKASLAEARAIFEQEGVPSVAKVGYRAAYRFVFINMVGQELDFQKRFAASVKRPENGTSL